MTSNKVVYTAIFDNYDVLVDPRNPSKNIEYICFTDDKTKIESEVWETIIVEDLDFSANLKNRIIKIKPHRFLTDCEESLYVDGNIFLKGDIEDIFQKYSDEKMVVPSHPVRDCIYEEAEVLKNTDKANNDKIEEQMKRYREEEFPQHYGLSANRVIYRKHEQDEIIDLMNKWWNELSKGAKRDQLSLSYVAWKREFRLEFMEESPSDESCDIFELMPHRRSGIMGWFDDYYIPIKAKRKENKVYYAICQSILYYNRSLTILKQEGPIEFLRKFKNHILSGSK